MTKLQAFKKELEKTARALQRDLSSFRFLIASKYFDLNLIEQFYQQGVRDFGENRVQEALIKMQALPKDIRWHFLGHLQSNKISKIKGRFCLIHSIDSLNLAQKLSQALEEPQAILIQIKSTEKRSQSGFSLEAFKKEYPKLLQLPNLSIQGLMTIAPQENPRFAFKTLRLLKEEYGEKHWELSMGMSSDYQVALEEGATLLRIGRSLI